MCVTVLPEVGASVRYDVYNLLLFAENTAYSTVSLSLNDFKLVSLQYFKQYWCIKCFGNRQIVRLV